MAERARAALAVARVATLQTGDRRTPPTMTVVRVEDAGDGLPRLWLDGSAPAVAGLASCRVATLTVAGPTPTSTLRLLGSFRMEHPDESGRRAYTPTLLSVRVTGPLGVPIPVDEFLRAEPDPWGHRAAVVLDHLARAHGDDLVAHVRALGHDDDVVVPRGLDRDGIDLALLGRDGVRSVRLVVAGGAAHLPEQLCDRVGLRLDCACTA